MRCVPVSLGIIRGIYRKSGRWYSWKKIKTLKKRKKRKPRGRGQRLMPVAVM
jgi:hypothetical protein